MEFFAGMARCTTHVRQAGHPAVRFDLMYNPEEEVPEGRSNYMDILTPSGLALPDFAFMATSTYTCYYGDFELKGQRLFASEAGRRVPAEMFPG